MKRLGGILSNLFGKFMPDPFVLVILLTGIALLGGMMATKSFVDMVSYWQSGFWQSLDFGMQFCILIVAGHALVMARPIRRLLGLIAERPKSPFTAIFVTGFVSCLFANVHWEPHRFELPALRSPRRWRRFVDTSREPGADVAEPGSEPPLPSPAAYVAGPRSVVVLVGR